MDKLWHGPSTIHYTPFSHQQAIFSHATVKMVTKDSAYWRVGRPTPNEKEID
jgi:hypothetical protein